MSSRRLVSFLLTTAIAIAASGCSAEANDDDAGETSESSESAFSSSDRADFNRAARSMIGFHIGHVVYETQREVPIRMVGLRWSVNPLDYVTLAILNTIMRPVQGKWDFVVVDFTYKDKNGKEAKGNSFFAVQSPKGSMMSVTGECIHVFHQYINLPEEDHEWRPVVPLIGLGTPWDTCKL